MNRMMKLFACCVVVGAGLLCPLDAAAWTRARLTDVDVVLQISPSGESEYETSARFEVSAGYFHGFDLAPQSDSELVPEKCYARIEGGLRTHVKIKKLFDGRQRVLLANRDSVHEGAVVFTLVHRTSLEETGSLAKYRDRVRLDWTPIIWDHGTDAMSVSIKLPGQSPFIDFENEAMRDYDVEARTADEVTFKKFRTVKWYPMRVVVDFDGSLVHLKNTVHTAAAGTDAAVAKAQDDRSLPATMHADEKAPFSARLIPLFASFLGLLLLLWKVRGVQRAHWDVGLKVSFRLLGHTGFLQRLMLSVIAVLLGVAAQMAGSIAASVPAFAVAASLWLMNRVTGELTPAPGGKWRLLTEDDLDSLKAVHRVYRRRRALLLDVSHPGGALIFVAAMSVSAAGIWVLYSIWPDVAFAVTISVLIWVLPIWFFYFRSELPVDPTVESFDVLKRWRKGISRLVSKMVPDARVQYWLREDENGPLEVRLRVQLMSGELNSLEIGTEIVKTQTHYRIRKVAVLKVAPGSETARKLAACPNAVEHHLTPDLEQEVIVLRNRRGTKDAGVTPLRQALSLIRI